MTAPGEIIARFGPDRSLVGVFTTPTTQVAGAPVIIIPNTGIAHRGSHHRLFVNFARALAEAGYPVLRFDLSGLGDSLSRGPLVDRPTAEEADMRAAADWVAAAGHGEIVLLGLCSGADRSIVYSGQDERVRGVILIDPTVPPTLRYLGTLLRARVVEIASRGFLPLFRRVALRRERRGDERSARAVRRGTGPAAWLAWYKVPAYLGSLYARSVAKNVAMLVVFTSGVQQRLSYRERLTDAFPRIDFRDLLSVRQLDGVHHLFVLERERRQAVDVMTQWLAHQRAPDPATGSGLRAGSDHAGESGDHASELVK